MRLRTFLLLVAVFFAIVAIAAALAGGAAWAIPIGILAAIVFVFALFNAALTKREMDRHDGDPDAALRDASEGGLPKAHVIGDERTALGDTPEVHAEASPHDFPKGAPERQAAERLAEEESGGHNGETTHGHDDPSDREERIRRPSHTRRR
jgi:hypothetical protein